MNYPDGVTPPGPDFDLKKLSPAGLQLMVGPYIGAVQAGDDVAGTAFVIKQWSQGMFQRVLLLIVQVADASL